jgi:cystathionine beta-lyase
MESFELTVEELRARRGRKWTQYPADVLPAWVADMDFTVPDVVQQALVRIVEQRDYGYGALEDYGSLAEAFSERMIDRFGWPAAPEQVQPLSELIQGMFAAVLAFSEPGDGVVVQTPIYPPFLLTIAQTGRRLVDNPLRDDGSRFVLDIDALRAQVDARTRILLFCNPHNPAGRVFERAELEAVAALALERDLIVLSDEIHADLIYDGKQHIPFATLGPEVAARTITMTSATKSYNIPGLRCALLHFGTPELRQRFHARIPERLLGQVCVPGIDATVMAWRHGQPWLDAVLTRLRTNRERVAAFVRDELPGVKHYSPESTYLAWLDCRALDLPQRPFEFFLEQARVALLDGADFGAGHGRSVRLNFATSEPILDEVLGRLANAVKGATVAR